MFLLANGFPDTNAKTQHLIKYRRKAPCKPSSYESEDDDIVPVFNCGLEFHRGHVTTNSTVHKDRSQQGSHRSVRQSPRSPRRNHFPTNQTTEFERFKAHQVEVKKERSRLAAQVRRNREGQCLILLQEALPISSQVLGPSVELEKSGVIRMAGNTLFFLNHICSILGTNDPPALSMHSRALHAIIVDPNDNRIVFISPTLAKSIGESWSSLIGASLSQVLQCLQFNRRLLSCQSQSKRKPQFSSLVNRPTLDLNSFFRFRRAVPSTLVQPHGVIPPPPAQKIKPKRGRLGRVIGSESQRTQNGVSGPTTPEKSSEVLCYCWTAMLLKPPSESQISQWIDLPDPVVFEYHDDVVTQCASDTDWHCGGNAQMTPLRLYLLQPLDLLSSLVHSADSTRGENSSMFGAAFEQHPTECCTILDARLTVKEVYGNFRMCFGPCVKDDLLDRSFLTLLHLDDMEHFTDALEAASSVDSIKWSGVYRVSSPCSSINRMRNYRWVRSLIVAMTEYDGWICLHQATGCEHSSPYSSLLRPLEERCQNRTGLQSTNDESSFDSEFILTVSPEFVQLHPEVSFSTCPRRRHVKTKGKLYVVRRPVKRLSQSGIQTECISKLPRQSLPTTFPSTQSSQSKPEACIELQVSTDLSPSDSFTSSCSSSLNQSEKISSSTSTSDCPSPGLDLDLDLNKFQLISNDLPSLNMDELAFSGEQLASVLNELINFDDLLSNGAKQEGEEDTPTENFLYTGIEADL